LTSTIKKEASFFKNLFLLVGFREAYFFLKNLLGMVVHPQLTTAKILKRRDFSQAFLVFGLPFNLWIILLGFGFLVWLIFHPAGLVFKTGLAIFLLIGFLLFLLTLYYFYWVLKYLKRIKN